MDSFYEQPRCFNTFQTFDQLHPTPVVPEVSMLVQNDASVTSSGDSMLLTYKAWKERNCNNLKTNTFQQSDILRKQVRFENRMQCESSNTVNSEPIETKTFEQMYLASLPSRQLDVSIIDSPKKYAPPQKENLENISPNVDVITNLKKNGLERDAYDSLKTYLPDFNVAHKPKTLDMYRSDCDAFNVGEKMLSKQYMHEKAQFSCDKLVETQQCNCKQNELAIKTNEPSVQDLLKIIQQQNEQLLLLQKQVATILNPIDKPKHIEVPQFEKYQTSTQIEKSNIPLKRPMPQFSLDVMTSFEVSIRRQQNLNRPCKDNYYESKITEITETSDKSNDIDENQIKPFFEKMTCGNPNGIVENDNTASNNIINIDMKDYSSDDCSDEEGEETTNGGWTFYNNIMGQVNEIFKKSGIRSFPVSDKPATNDGSSEDLMKHNVMKKVKEATVKHLKSIGVHVPAMNVSDEALGRCPDNINPSNISFAVKQLLMKYLPDEQLAKIPQLQEQQKIQPQHKQLSGLIQRRPEFSMATLQYMQKYNLLNEENTNMLQGGPAQRINQPMHNFERILDITAIRQQPKLL